MKYPKAYINYLVHFHGDRDYFECHEELEEHWKIVDPGNKESYWVGLIQLAVALYHHRRGNFHGASRTLEKAITIITNQKGSICHLGIQTDDLLDTLKLKLNDMKNKAKYESINLPIYDQNLLKICISQCHQLGIHWGMNSDINNEHLIHKHKLRDRSDVIAERERQIRLKQQK